MIENYSEHKPQMLIYNNREVVSDGIADRNAACLVGICKPSFTVDNFFAQMTPLLAGAEINFTAPLSNYTPVSDFLLQFLNPSKVAFVDATGATIENPGVSVTKDDSTGVINVKVTTKTTKDIYFNLPKAAFSVNYNGTTKVAMQLIKSSSDITSYLGLVDSNPSASDFNSLAFAATIGLTAGGGKPFYVDCVASDDVASFTASLSKLARTDLFLNLWVDSDKIEVINLAKANALTASQPNVQRWRGVYASTESKTSSDVIARSKALSYNGVVNVWSAGSYYLTSDGYTTKEVAMPNKYLAAGIACLRSNLLPQQGMSKMELGWISSIPASYTSFTDEELNEIAANGTFIIAQDDDRTTPYVRHQLTTDSSHGVLYYEDNIRGLVYNVNYGVKDLFKEYPGRRNITKSLLQEIENKLGDYLLSLTYTGASLEERRIGPMIVEVDLNSIKAVRDSQFKDRVNLSGDYYVATALNVLKVSLNTYLGL